MDEAKNEGMEAYQNPGEIAMQPVNPQPMMPGQELQQPLVMGTIPVGGGFQPMPGMGIGMAPQPGIAGAPGFQPMALPGAAVFNPMQYTMAALQHQGLESQDGVLGRHLSVTDRVEAVKNAAKRAKRGKAWRKKQEWYYAIKMPGFERGSDSQDEINFKRVLYHITEVFGDDPKVEGLGVIHRPFCARAQGRADKRNAYIRITASVYRMEQWAEQDKLRVRCRKHLGGGFHFFSIKEKAQNAYSHPQTLAAATAAFDFEAEGEDEDDTTLLEICKNQREDGSCGCNIFMPYQRQAMIYKRLEQVFDKIMKKKDGEGIQAAIEGEIIIAVVPLHTLRKPDEFYKSRKEIYEDYCNPKYLSFFRTPWTFSKWNRRFVSWLHDYYGSKTATYFAFLHYYTVALLLLAIPGVVLAVYQIGWSSDSVWILVFAIYCAFWGTLFLEFWNRKNAAWSSRWDTIDFEQREETLREFSLGKDKAYGFYEQRGTWVSLAEYTKTSQEKYHGIEEFVPTNCEESSSPWWRTLKQVVNLIITAVFVVCVIMLTIRILTFRAKLVSKKEDGGYGFSSLWGVILGGGLNALSIAILDNVWLKIAVKLNDWENHRTRTEYEDKLIVKVFCFQFVNAYTSLFYIAFFKAAAQEGRIIHVFGDKVQDCGGKPGDCVADLSSQLAVLLVTRLFIQNITELAIPYLKAHWTLWRAKRGQLSQEETAKRKLKPLYVEKQCSLATYDRGSVPGTFYDYNELAIQFGYVLLFAPAFPLGALLALINNIVESMTDGVKMLFDTQRPQVQEVSDIGTWYYIFRFMAVLAVITNSLLVAFTSDQLSRLAPGEELEDGEDAPPGLSNFTKLAIVISAEHIVLGIQFFISRTIPNRPPWLRVQLERTQSIERVEKQYSDYLNRVGGVETKEDEEAEHEAIMNVELEYDEDDDSDSEVDDDGVGLAAMQYDEEDSQQHDV